jgi:Outer membrane protein beta-barrel domain
MHAGVRGVVWPAIAVFGLSMIVPSPAQAQSALTAGDPSSSTAALKLDYDAAVRPDATTVSLRRKEVASFLRQGGAANEDSGVSFGVLGMLTWPSIDIIDEDDDEIKSRTGWGVGGWVGGNRNGRIGFVGEFIYGVRKARDEDNDFDVDFEVFQITAPVHINIGSRSRNRVSGYIAVGPSFTFNLGQKGNGEAFLDDAEFNGVDIGVIAGAGIEFFRVAIEGRGNWGLNEVSDEGDFTTIKTTTFELLFKFAFN